MPENSWSSLLDHVEHALVQAEVEARQREEAHPCETAIPDESADIDWTGGMSRLEERLANMRSGLREQELQVEQVGRELAASEEAVREWLAAVRAVAKSGQQGQR